MAGISDGVKSWLLDKYAKFVQVKNLDGLHGIAVDSISLKKSGEWKVKTKKKTNIEPLIESETECAMFYTV